MPWSKSNQYTVNILSTSNKAILNTSIHYFFHSPSNQKQQDHFPLDRIRYMDPTTCPNVHQLFEEYAI